MESRDSDMENELQSLATDIEDLKTTAGRILLKLETLTGKVDDLSRYVGNVIRRLDKLPCGEPEAPLHICGGQDERAAI